MLVPALHKRVGGVASFAALLLPLAALAQTTRAASPAPPMQLGIAATGALNLELLQRIVERIPEGTWEFVCHPGYHDGELDKTRTRLRESRVKELKILTSAAARQALARCGVELISYRDFAA